MDRKLCTCHGEPMDPSPGSNGGWNCTVKSRERKLRHYHAKGYVTRRKRMLADQRARILTRLEELRLDQS